MKKGYKILLHIVVISLYVCSVQCNTEDKDEKITLTLGINFSNNPASPRIGIEIRHNELFFCRERKKEKEWGKYNFYRTKINPKVFLMIKKEVLHAFRDTVWIFGYSNNFPITHQLNYFLNNKKRIIEFNGSMLRENQIEVINKILSLQELKMERMDYHAFPVELLTEKFPGYPPDNILDNVKYWRNDSIAN